VHDHNTPEPIQTATTPAQAPSTTQTFFHVDRRGTLAGTGGVIDLNGGLSEHGRQYQVGIPAGGYVSWNGASSTVVSVELPIENFYELHRRTRHPGLPSRFQSLFAFTTINDAQDFATKNGSPPIFELSVPVGAVMHRGDMDWLKAGNFDFMLDCADKYWTGQPMTVTPLWEVLLALPVTMTLTQLP
jgi:hypothetical protein